MIVVLHGFGSSAITSNTVKVISEHFPDELVLTPSYPSEHADKTAFHLKAIVDTALANNIDEAELIFIGVSLGGFWARYLANLYPGCKLVMLNPAIEAHATMQKYVGVDIKKMLGTDLTVTPNHCEAFRKYFVAKDRPEMPITIIVAENDEVISPATVRKLIGEDRAHIISTTGGHRLDGTLVGHLKDIEYAVNNLTL